MRRLIWVLLILGGTAALALLMIGRGALGGLTCNPAGPELMEDGYVVLALGALALAEGSSRAATGASTTARQPELPA
jgi:hypothetical protein